MKVRVTQEPDSLDLEELRDMTLGRAYQMLSEKHAAMLESYRVALEGESDPMQMKFLQGQIANIRTVMKLPQTIHDEVRAKQRRNPQS